MTVRRASQLLGPPKVTITYRGTGTPGTTRVFAQLVNLDRGVVVGNQSAPIPVKLDGKQHTISRRLVPIASTAKAGARYQLQLVAGSAIWAGQRATGTLNASRISVELPVASRSGLGARGRRCSTARRFTVVLAETLRRQIVERPRAPARQARGPPGRRRQGRALPLPPRRPRASRGSGSCSS